jgi:serine/threonine protein kinase
MSFTALGRYQIRGEIGRGNMGVVYRAHDPVIDRPVALKTVVLPESITDAERETFLKRFFQEAKTAGKLLHPNIVVTYDAATDESTGTPFIAMELIDGESLGERLEKEDRIGWQQAVDWVIAIASGLHQAHRAGIVHRDIKPANIMITGEGVPKITDFGIAKLPTADLTQTGIIMGTPYFMSPEQLRGETLDGRSDLFSLGAVLYNILTGTRPFEGAEIAAIASQVLYKNPPPTSELVGNLPSSLDGVIARALMKSSAERYASGDELADDLTAVRRGASPRRALSIGERTQPTKLSAPHTPAVVPEAQSPASSSGTVQTVRGSRPLPPVAFIQDKLRDLPRRHIAAVIASALVFTFLVTALVFREDLAQWKLFFDGERAAASGQLVLSEQKLEELQSRNPDFRKASDLLLEVSSELVLAELPLELTVKHHHRLGSCTGRLTLREDGLEYSSKSHGHLEWSFARVRVIDGGSWELAIRTSEDDMLGLLDRKNYNFSLLDPSPGDEFWKRYERLFERQRRASEGT